MFDADTAEARGQAGEDVILVRWETSPDDIHGLVAAKGILTAHGGIASHAALVARGMGKPCVAGCGDLEIDLDSRVATIGGHAVAEGDVITVDGGTGSVILGAVDLIPARLNDDLDTILGWGDDVRRLEVHANADTPADALKARELGAEGIGLCRTEHMFFGEERLPVVQEMILADDEAARRAALDRLLPFQQSDFEGIFEAMAGLPVTIRLLDPPLHEFLPSLEDATDRAHAGADQGAARGEPDARHPRLPARPAVAGDLRDAGARDRARRTGRSRPHRPRTARGDHAPARRLRGGAAPAARAHDPHRRRRRLRPRAPHRHDDRAPARVRAGGRDRRATRTSSRSARTT